MAKFTDLPLSEQRRLIKESPNTSLSDIISAYDKENAPQSTEPSLTTTLPFSLENAYKSGGKIHIKPSKRGTFTAAATRHGKSVQEFASQVLAHPENYSPAMRKKANFARNAAKWHAEGGHIYDGYNEPFNKLWEVQYPEAPEEVSGGIIPASVVTASLPAKFRGSQSAAKRYAEGYKWANENVTKPTNEVARKYVYPAVAATAAAPLAVDAAAAVVANPVLRSVADFVGTVDGLRNAVSENGVAKTVRLAREGNTFGAIKSGVGDALDIAGVSDLIRTTGKIASKSKALRRALELYNYGKQKELGYIYDIDWPAYKGLHTPQKVQNDITPIHTKTFPALTQEQVQDAVRGAIDEGSVRADFDLIGQRLTEDFSGYSSTANKVAEALGVPTGYSYPEFLEYVYRTGKNPQDPSTIKDFAAVQRSAVRGVVAKTADDAKTFLTVPAGNRTGGDRLGSRGGVYTSNSYDIGDKFSRPLRGQSSGVVGKVQFPTTAVGDYETVAQQLDNIHQDTFNYDDVLRGLPYDAGVTFTDISDAAKEVGFISGESRYSTRTGDKLPVMEKVYLGKEPLTLQETTFKKASENANRGGRTGWGEQKEYREDDSLFIPHYTSEKDAAKLTALYTALKKKKIDWNSIEDVVRDYEKKGELATALADKAFFTKIGKNRKAIFGSSAGILGTGALGTGIVLGAKEVRNRQDWEAENKRALVDAYFGDSYPPKNPDGSINIERALEMEDEVYPQLEAAYKSWKRENRKAEGGPVDVFRKLTAPTYDTPSFSDAFGQARKDGKSYFKWNGRRYNTKLNTEQFRETNPVNYLEGYSYIDAARRIKEVENSKDNPRGGYDAGTDRWYPHRSHEGGADTIAYGIKLSNGTPEAKLAKRQGYLTDTQANEAVDILVRTYGDSAERVYNKKFGEGAWDDLSEKSKSILIDYEYNPGLAKFPNLMTGFHDADLEKIKANYKRYSRGRELGRNRTLEKDIDSLATFYPILAK